MERDFKFFSRFFVENQIVPRDAQIKAIEKLAKNWDSKKYFILDLPTGVGKSFIAMAVIRACRNGFLLTSSKQLQQQYIDGPGDAVDLRGRGNYECAPFPDMNCSNSPCRTVTSLAERCMATKKCPYANQRNLAMGSQTLLTNYAYFLFATLCGPMSAQRGDSSPRAVMVCDEAHSLEDHLVSFAEVILEGEKVRQEIDSDVDFAKASKDLQPLLEKVFKDTQIKIKEINDELDELFNSSGRFGSSKASDLPKWKIGKAKHLNGKKDRIDKWMKKLEIYFETKNTIDWIVDHDPKKDYVRLIPLEAKGLFSKFCEKLAGKFVFMSATIGDPKEFAIELGLDFNDCCLIRADSDFPPENAPIVTFAVSKMNYSSIESALPKIKAAVDDILEHHPNDKGIIHTANYRIAKYLADNSKNSRRFLHRNQGLQTSTNEELFKEHRRSKGPSVLLSPSMGTGISLDDDLARFQIIVKLPFSSMGDVRVKKKMAIRNSWYVNKMFLELMQSSGRPIRSKDDAAITYVLDSAWEYFYDMMEGKLPEWFKKRVVRRNKK